MLEGKRFSLSLRLLGTCTVFIILNWIGDIYVEGSLKFRIRIKSGMTQVYPRHSHISRHDLEQILEIKAKECYGYGVLCLFHPEPCPHETCHTY